MERRCIGLSWLVGACTVMLAGTIFPGWEGYPDVANLSGRDIVSIATLFAPGLAMLMLS